MMKLLKNILFLKKKLSNVAKILLFLSFTNLALTTVLKNGLSGT